MKKILNALTHAERAIGMVSLSVMVFLTAGNVVARKLFSTSWSFTEELTCALFILITMLGAALSARKGSHIGLNFITDKLPAKFEKPLVIITMIIAVLFCGVLLVTGIDMVKSEFSSGMNSAALHIREWIYGLSIPVGAVLLLIHFVENGIGKLKEKEER